MAEWKHKESTWHPKHTDRRSSKTTVWTLNSKGSPERVSFTHYMVSTDPKEKAKAEQYLKSEIKTFSQWLDAHCEGGWEVIKISRDFNPDKYDFNRTWCVFRKQV